MKITLTGSLGRISKPLATELIQQGHSVTIISSDPQKKQAIQDLGGIPAIGTIDDVPFLTEAFKGADIVYLMEPPVNFFDKTVDLYDYYNHIAHNFVAAVKASGVKRAIHLSSIGAHAGAGVGMLNFHNKVENILQELPADVAISFMRPVGFYYNMFAFIPTIRNSGSIVSNYAGDEKEPWVSPFDIAHAIAEEMGRPASGRKVQYIASDELSPDEVASILGKAIGQPDLKWIAIPDEQLMNGMIAAGINPQIAKGYVEMNASRVNGVLYEDYYRNRPVLGKTKVADFARDFAAAFAADQAPATH